jgi:hypothetical protein
MALAERRSRLDLLVMDHDELLAYTDSLRSDCAALRETLHRTLTALVDVTVQRDEARRQQRRQRRLERVAQRSR